MKRRKIIGATVRLKRDICTNGGRVFAAGETFTITQSFRGYTLKAPGAWVTRVPHDAVEFIDPQNDESNK
nr:MAG TPA: hypothetical protein [Caudoviricetes sp.]